MRVSGFDAAKRLSLPCTSGWRGRFAPGQPLLCRKPFSWSLKSLNADSESTRAQRSRRPEGEDEDPCPPWGSAEAWCLHARLHDHAEEAELGAPEGRARPAHERHG